MSIAEVTRSITKHNYLIFDIDDIPQVLLLYHQAQLLDL
jgi:hypothetical protein